MSYPQPDATGYSNTGDFFRLTTELTTPGDIYESEQSSHAFAIGANSDVANVNVGYFDGQVPTFFSQLQLGNTSPWVGRVDARNDTGYAPSGRSGRVLIWPGDLYDPLFTPTGFDPELDTLSSITPILEVIQYFTPQGSLDVRRNDKSYRFQESPATVRASYVIIPYWGRRYASLRVSNRTGEAMTWAVSGITYFFNNQFLAIETLLDTATIPGAVAAQRLTVIGESSGMFDALMLKTQANNDSGPTPILVVVSDTPGGGL